MSVSQLASKAWRVFEQRVIHREHFLRVQEWYRARGDQTLRLNYDLGPDSMVIDVGGYEGQWASDIYGKYRCKVHVFEPVEKFAHAIGERFERNPSVLVHAYGLGGRDTTVEFEELADRSSIFSKGRGKTVRVPIRQAAKVFDELGLSRIDLIKINIEGGEYELLQHFVDTGWISRISSLQIQFHDFVPDAKNQMSRIQEQLRRTHDLTWGFPFVWENWRIRRTC